MAELRVASGHRERHGHIHGTAAAAANTAAAAAATAAATAAAAWHRWEPKPSNGTDLVNNNMQ